MKTGRKKKGDKSPPCRKMCITVTQEHYDLAYLYGENLSEVFRDAFIIFSEQLTPLTYKKRKK